MPTTLHSPLPALGWLPKARHPSVRANSLEFLSLRGFHGLWASYRHCILSPLQCPAVGSPHPGGCLVSWKGHITTHFRCGWIIAGGPGQVGSETTASRIPGDLE